MRKSLLAPAVVLAASCVLVLTATSSAQRTPAAVTAPPVDGKVISEATRAAGRELTAGQKKEVTAFLTFHAKRMVDAAKQPEAVKASREALLAAHATGSGAGFRRFYATSAAKDFAPTVLKSDAPVVLVSGGLFLSRLRGPEILPALDAMAGHGNPAVRYYGMKSYAAMRDELLMRAATRGKLLAMVEARVGAEASPAVLTELFSVMDFSNAAGIGRATKVALVSGLQTVVAARRQNLRDADAAMATTFVTALGSMRKIADDTRQRGAVYDMLAAIMANAGQAYKEELAKAVEFGDAATRASNALGFLLLKCEGVLTELTGRSDTPVGKALDLSEGLRGPAVKLAVNQWVGTETEPGWLNRFNIKPPVVLSRTQEAPTP